MVALVRQRLAGLAPISRAQRARLQGRIEALRLDVDGAMALPLASLPPSAPRRLASADRRHRDAEALLAKGFAEESWRQVHAAERDLLHLADLGSLVSAYHRLSAEGTDKLSGWRLEAFTRALGPEPVSEVDLDAPADAAVLGARADLGRRLADARAILDEHFGNEAARARVVGRQLRVAAAGMSAMVASYVAMTALGWPAQLAGDGASVLLTSSAAVVVVALLGMLGAFVSIALTSLASRGATRVPQLEQAYSISLVRPILGAASAVTAGLLVETGLQSVVTVTDAGLVGVALAAGFTERLLRRTVASLASGPTEAREET
jgi:hypothetical protein